MFKKAMPVLMLAETSLHVGSGTDLGLVDLPIQRERHTGFPKIEASGIKGCFREAFEAMDSQAEPSEHFPGVSGDDATKRIVNIVFGPDKGDLHAGALGFTDARLLLFPVKSMRGVFAWVTCPQVLERFGKEVAMAGVEEMPAIPGGGTVPEECDLVFTDGGDPKIILEEYAMPVRLDAACGKMAEWLAKAIFGQEDVYRFWSEKMTKGLAVLPDNDFRDFVEQSTEVVARTRIDNNTGTVAKGALFYEEYLPQDSVLYTLALATPLFIEEEKRKRVLGTSENVNEEAVMKYFIDGLPRIIQIGGNATIGKGFVRLALLEV